ncbi:hypothetical protein Tco_0944449 [Tanacetum coccineum]
MNDLRTNEELARDLIVQFENVMSRVQNHAVSSSNSQIPEAERTRYTLQTNPHMNDLRTVEELARDLARDNNNESSSGEEEVEEE